MNARYLPWVRQTTFAGNSLVVRAAGRDVTVPVSRYGPGDVAGIASGQIRRRDPLPGTLAMPPNLLPSVEFNSPDFPWLVSPLAPDATGRLQPWLALIVVEAASGDPLARLPDAKLPVIEVSRAQLPLQAELALWAHTQLDENGPASIDVVRRGISRVLSPRALSPNRRYVACLVPTFEAGRLAGLGQPVPDARSAAPAWSPGSGSVLLPVYDSWAFTTAESGDLETMARRLHGVDLKEFTKPKLLDVSRVSGNVAGKLAAFEGALRPFKSDVTWTGAAVGASATKIKTELEHTVVGGVPIVGLPLYGSIASGQASPVAGWLQQLNLDPRRRAAAGFGGQIIRQHQEELVDEAWRQAGEIERARREREGALLADAANARLRARMIAPLGVSSAVIAMAPALARTRDVPGQTMAARVAASVVPAPVLDAGFRRILAVKAPLAARKAGQGIRRSVAFQNTLSVTPRKLPWTPWRCVTKPKIQMAMGLKVWLPGVLGDNKPPISLPPITGLAPVAAAAAQTTASVESGTAVTSGAAAAAAVATVVMEITTPPRDAFLAFLDESVTRLPSVTQILKPAALVWPAPTTPEDPSTARARFTARVTLGNRARVTEAKGVEVIPKITQPLSAWLDPAWLMTGIDVPPDAAGLLETNSAFIEALVVGANHELARELLWRGVPLARNSSPLVRFFDSRGSTTPQEIQPISQWSPADSLGAHVSAGELCVLILRSPLVSHLSETTIFLTQAVADGPYRKPGTNQILPVFRGSAGLDTAYFGFNLTPADIMIEPGYYFVIQELSGAPRFGLDENTTEIFNTWNDLAWSQVEVAGGYISVAAKKPVPAQPRGLEWGKDSAHMAAIVMQRPLRVSIHTSLLMPKTTS